MGDFVSRFHTCKYFRHCAMLDTGVSKIRIHIKRTKRARIQFWTQYRMVKICCKYFLVYVSMYLSSVVPFTMCNKLRGETNAGRSRLYSEATGVGRSGSHTEQQTHSGDGIS